MNPKVKEELVEALLIGATDEDACLFRLCLASEELEKAASSFTKQLKAYMQTLKPREFKTSKDIEEDLASRLPTFDRFRENLVKEMIRE